MIHINLLQIGTYCGAIVTIFTAFGLGYKFFYKKFIKKFNETFDDLQNRQNKALISLLREAIIQKTDIILERGTITNEEFNTLSSLHKDYKNLGGNGTMSKRVDMCVTLPKEKGQFDKYIKKGDKHHEH